MRRHLVAPAVATGDRRRDRDARRGGDRRRPRPGARGRPVSLVPLALLLALAAAFSATNDPYEYLLVPTLGYAMSAGPIVVAALGAGLPLLLPWLVVGGHLGTTPGTDSEAISAVVGVDVPLVIICFVGPRIPHLPRRPARAGGDVSAAGKVAGVELAGDPPALSAAGLGRSYDGYIALGSFSVEIDGGELVALIGPNGAGKTTFLNLAAGLLEPTSGSIEIAGDAARLDPRPPRPLLPARHARLLRGPQRRRAPRIRGGPAWGGGPARRGSTN